LSGSCSAPRTASISGDEREGLQVFPTKDVTKPVSKTHVWSHQFAHPGIMMNCRGNKLKDNKVAMSQLECQLPSMLGTWHIGIAVSCLFRQACTTYVPGYVCLRVHKDSIAGPSICSALRCGPRAWPASVSPYSSGGAGLAALAISQNGLPGRSSMTPLATITFRMLRY
jgi:hypothetical protein